MSAPFRDANGFTRASTDRVEAAVEDSSPKNSAGASVMAARSEDRPALLENLLTKGVRTNGAARAVANKAKDAADPWARRMSSRQASKIADRLDNFHGTADLERDAEVVATTIRVMLGGPEAAKTLNRLPKQLVALIREALARE